MEDELACIKKHLDQQSISLVPMPQVIFLEFKKLCLSNRNVTSEETCVAISCCMKWTECPFT